MPMPDATDGYADEDGGTAFAVKEWGMAGVDLRTGVKPIGVSRGPSGVTGDLGDRGEVTGTDVLVAVGREPVTRDLDLDAAGVRLDARGCVGVDDRLAATAPRTWAVGDAAGSPQFTHVSLDNYRIRSRPFREPACFGTRAASGRQSWTADAAVHPS
ncbi:FAD-dependent oxidoreductase [Streptomyces nigra]|uniref:FAD-dependent oxidoreductase n=2 Tax=Streptomyces nigra TaxID=1827580 RepID=UPI00380B5A2C